MNISIIAVGKDKAKIINSLCEDYFARAKWNIKLKEVEASKSLPENKKKEKEGDLILKEVNKGSRLIVLDERGKNFSSKQFASKIFNDFANIDFVIGGACGHSDSVKNKADLMLSLGNMTWPHMLARLMLSEQIYRAYTILNNHPYHKE